MSDIAQAKGYPAGFLVSSARREGSARGSAAPSVHSLADSGRATPPRAQHPT